MSDWKETPGLTMEVVIDLIRELREGLSIDTLTQKDGENEATPNEQKEQP